MPGRSFNSGNYRHGFNGKENDEEWDKIDFGARIYDSRIAKFLSLDPLATNYPFYTPYQFAGNTPIQAIDVDGKYVEPVGKDFAYKLAGDINEFLLSFYGKKNAPQVEIYTAKKVVYEKVTDPYTRSSRIEKREIVTGYFIMPKKGTPWAERSKGKANGRYIKALFEQLMTKEVNTKVYSLRGETKAGAYTLKDGKGYTYSPSNVALWDELPTISEFKEIDGDPDKFYILPEPEEVSYYEDDGFLVEETITKDSEPNHHGYWTLSGTFLHEVVNHVNYEIGNAKDEPAQRMQNIFNIPRSSQPDHQGTDAKSFSSGEQKRLDQAIEKYKKG